jgi:hypothetical protein
MGYWRNLHNKELWNFYSSPNIVIAMKSTKYEEDGGGVPFRDPGADNKTKLK